MKIDHYIADGQDPKVVEKLLLKLQDILTPEEVVTYIAVQKMPAVTLFPDSIALTDKRIFICESSKLGWATDFKTFPWTTIRDITFKEGVLAAKFVLSLKKDDEQVIVNHIPKNQVRKLYQLASERFEKHQQGLESAADPRIAASGVPDRAVAASAPADELTVKLQKLKSLFENELITQAEYDQKKNELLSQL